MRNRKLEQEKKSKTYELRRVSHMENGKLIAQKNDPLHLKACMLYWAEGTKKKKGNFTFTNCDINMHLIMMEFIKKYFPQYIKEMKFTVNYYETDSIKEKDILDFWCKTLSINPSQFNKLTERSKYYKIPSTLKYQYGIFVMRLFKREILYHIFGAINEYCSKEIFSSKLY
jgi:hypothetical protein